MFDAWAVRLICPSWQSQGHTGFRIPSAKMSHPYASIRGVKHLHSQVAPVVVQYLPTTSSGVTQPMATLIAAFVALIVACVTAFGLWLNHKQHQEKETAAATERRRKEAVDAMVSAWDTAVVAWTAVTITHRGVYRDTPTPGVLPSPQEIDDAVDQCRTVEARLQLLSLDGTRSMSNLIDVLAGIAEKIDRSDMPFGDFERDRHTQARALAAREDLMDSFRREINSFSTKYEPSVGRTLSGLKMDEDRPPRDS